MAAFSDADIHRAIGGAVSVPGRRKLRVVREYTSSPT